MRSILDFLYNNRVPGYFLLLEVVCVILIISTDHFYGASFFNSSNAFSGSVQTLGANTTDYFRLRTVNENLASENALLRQQLAEAISRQSVTDSTPSNFQVIPGRVINNTYRRSTNYLTMEVGEKDGVTVGMGAVSGHGVIGRVMAVSRSYCTIASILNPSTMTSAEIKRTGTLCTAQWQDQDFRKISIKFVPRHIELQEGDTIVTSGYNAIYPPGVLIGIVDSVFLSKESPFYKAEALLSTDFSSIDYAYLIKNLQKSEIDSLTTITLEEL